MTTVALAQTQAESDYDYIATLYHAIAKHKELDNVSGFERSAEDMVGTFFYDVKEDFLYINPCIGCYLNGETIAEDCTVSAALVSLSGDLISNMNFHYVITGDIESDVNAYTNIVKEIISLIAHVG